MNSSYNKMKQYVVEPGDSLYKIAKAHNTTVEDLMSINHLYSSTIYPNQILFIPNYQSSSHHDNTYITADGDSLKDILNKFNIKLDDLQSFNDIDKLKLEGNQMLLIEKINSCKMHKVEYGETVEDILAKYQLSPLELLHLNAKEFLEPGEEIIVEK